MGDGCYEARFTSTVIPISYWNYKIYCYEVQQAVNAASLRCGYDLEKNHR